MNAAFEIWRALPDTSVWLLEGALRGAVLACLTAAVLMLLGKSSAAVRHAAWSLAAVAMLAMPVVTPWTPSTYAPIAITYGGPAAVEASAADTIAVGAASWAWLGWLYGAVLLALGGRLLLGWWASRRLLAGAREVESARVHERFAQARIRLGVSKTVRLLESDGLSLPIAAGFVRPVVGLPTAWRSWSTPKLEAVLLHELAHVARRDIAPAWVAAIGRCLFWFNPLAWYAENRMRGLAEQACDEAAIESGCSPADYAQALVEIAGSASRSQRSLGWAAFAMARRPAVSDRVDRILTMEPKSGRPGSRRWGKAAALVAPFALLAASLAPAQDGGGIRGIVLDPSGARVPRARVMLLDDSQVVATVLTSGAGEFDVKAEPGSYGIAISATGFALFAQQNVVVTQEAGDNLEIKLRVESVEEALVIAPADVADRADRTRTPTRIRVGGNVQRTRLLHMVNPQYPPGAKEDGVQGTVIFDAIIGVDGDLLSLRVRDNVVDPRLIDAAIEAVRQWRYRPTLLNGKPVEVQTVMEINFTLAP